MNAVFWMKTKGDRIWGCYKGNVRILPNPCGSIIRTNDVGIALVQNAGYVSEGIHEYGVEGTMKSVWDENGVHCEHFGYL